MSVSFLATFRVRWIVFLVSLSAFSSGCMFDVVSVKQVATPFVASVPPLEEFTLNAGYEISIGTGFKTRLKPGTKWKELGQLPQGKVFVTRDQVVTVEASHIHEAGIVVHGDTLVGFFLLVEKTFTPAKEKNIIK